MCLFLFDFVTVFTFARSHSIIIVFLRELHGWYTIVWCFIVSLYSLCHNSYICVMFCFETCFPFLSLILFLFYLSQFLFFFFANFTDHIHSICVFSSFLLCMPLLCVLVLFTCRFYLFSMYCFDTLTRWFLLVYFTLYFVFVIFSHKQTFIFIVPYKICYVLYVRVMFHIGLLSTPYRVE